MIKFNDFLEKNKTSFVGTKINKRLEKTNVQTNNLVNNYFVEKQHSISVKHSVNKLDYLQKRALLYTDKQFTLIDAYYSHQRATKEPQYAKQHENKGVIKHLSLRGLVEYNNRLTHTKDKSKQPPILKGIFKNGTAGLNLAKNTPVLFYDIDIKENNENKHLYNNSNSVFEALKIISIFTARSHSGQGIYGAFYVDALNLPYSENNTQLHKKISNSVFEHLENTLLSDFNVTFDKAQGKFRQIRFLTAQLNAIRINENFYSFDAAVKVTEIKHKVKRFQRTKDNNSLVEKIVNKTIETAINNIKFAPSGQKREARLRGGKTLGGLVAGGFLRRLDALELLNSTATDKGGVNTNLAALEIGIKKPFNFDYLLTKHNVKETQNKGVLKHISVITYDKTVKVQKWFSEAKNVLINEIIKYKRILIAASTGTGKTNFFVKHFANENRKTLLCVPTVAIAKQVSEFYGVELLTAKNKDFDIAVNENILVATYEQGIKVLKMFDYIVIDEAHNLLNYQAIKLETVNKLISLTKEYNKNTILLTATPHPLLSKLYHTIKVVPKVYNFEKVNIYYHNSKKSSETLYNLVNYIKDKQSISLVKYNNIDVLRQVKNHFVESGIYKENEILVIYSDDKIESSKEYNDLLNSGLLSKDVRIVLATSKINDGLSIKDKRIKDVYYVENQSFVNPLDFRQFIARARIKEDVNYHLFMYERKTDVNINFSPLEYYNKLVDYNKQDLQQRNYLLNQSKETPQIYGNLKTTFSKIDNYSIINNKFELFTERLVYKAANKEFRNFNTKSLIEFLKLNFGINSVQKNNFLTADLTNDIEEVNYDNYIYTAFKNKFEKLLMFYLYFSNNKKNNTKIKKLLGVEFSTLQLFENIENFNILKVNIKRVQLLINRYFELTSLNIDNKLIESYLFENKGGEKVFKSSYNYRKIYNLYSWHKLNSLDIRTAEKYLNSNELSIDGFMQINDIKQLTYKLSRLKGFKTKKQLSYLVGSFFHFTNSYFNNSTNVNYFINCMFDVEKNNKKKIKILKKKSFFDAIELIK